MYIIWDVRDGIELLAAHWRSAKRPSLDTFDNLGASQSTSRRELVT